MSGAMSEALNRRRYPTLPASPPAYACGACYRQTPQRGLCLPCSEIEADRGLSAAIAERRHVYSASSRGYAVICAKSGALICERKQRRADAEAVAASAEGKAGGRSPVVISWSTRAPVGVRSCAEDLIVARAVKLRTSEHEAIQAEAARQGITAHALMKRAILAAIPDPATLAEILAADPADPHSVADL